MAGSLRRGGALLGILLGVTACAARGGDSAARLPSQPLPVITLAGQKVAVFPATLLVAAPSLGWGDAELGSREERLRHADSILAATLMERAPEIDWILPGVLRQAAARAGGMLGDPDRMGTAVLRNPGFKSVPFPLVADMRNLTGVVGDRYALVPAAIAFDRDSLGRIVAQVNLVIPDLRSGAIRWRSVVAGEGAGPWTALQAALVVLTPGLQ